jgi:hypothetical protein
MTTSKEPVSCPKCGTPMEPKLAVKQTSAQPNLGEPLVEFDCKECGHIEGRHVSNLKSS